MITYKLGNIEMKFAELIWENEPISSGELVKLSATTLNWKKPTTYTVLRKLCKKGFFQNENSIVTSCLSKEDYKALQSEYFMKETFSGSLPRFLAAFTERNKLSKKDIEEIRKIIDDYKEV